MTLPPKLVRNKEEDDRPNLGFGIHEMLPDPIADYRPKVQIIAPENERIEAKHPEVKVVICPTCQRYMQYVSSTKYYICTQDLTTIDPATEKTPGPNEEIDLGDTSPAPAIISFKKRKKLEGREINPAMEITGSLRKTNIRTTNLGAALSLDNSKLKQYFQGELSIE
jgi:hypothetical protein